MYRYTNVNPYNRHIDDCVIRAISILTDRTWKEVFDELSELASQEGYMFDNVVFVEDYLDDKYPRECHYSKTVGEFAEEYPIGRYLLSMDNHVTAIINGCVLDTFDPRNFVMRCAWRIK